MLETYPDVPVLLNQNERSENLAQRSDRRSVNTMSAAIRLIDLISGCCRPHESTQCFRQARRWPACARSGILPWASVPLCLWLALVGNVAQADDPRWLLQTSALTVHYDPDPDHNNQQELIGLEYTRDDDWLLGGARLLNSFSQESVYLYTGRSFDLAGGPLFAKLTGGLLHGYRGEYEDKIPFNQLGVAPAIIPSLGIRGDVLSSEVVFLGAAAVMVNLGIRF